MKLTLEIDLGNEGVRTWFAVRLAIHASLAATKYTHPAIGNTGTIRDSKNGNLVGKWSVND